MRHSFEPCSTCQGFSHSFVVVIRGLKSGASYPRSSCCRPLAHPLDRTIALAKVLMAVWSDLWNKLFRRKVATPAARPSNTLQAPPHAAPSHISPLKATLALDSNAQGEVGLSAIGNSHDGVTRAAAAAAERNDQDGEANARPIQQKGGTYAETDIMKTLQTRFHVLEQKLDHIHLRLDDKLHGHALIPTGRMIEADHDQEPSKVVAVKVSGLSYSP
jgi:hypothetical protein